MLSKILTNIVTTPKTVDYLIKVLRTPYTAHNNRNFEVEDFLFSLATSETNQVMSPSI